LGWHRIAAEQRFVDHRGGFTRERQRARAHVVEDGAEREQIGAGIGELSARLLRRHVRHRPHRGARQRQLVAGRDRLELRGGQRTLAPARRLDLGEPEVEDLHLATGVHEDVGGLDVPVHDSFGVRRLQRIGDLDRQCQQRFHLQALPGDRLRQRLALEQLHDHKVLPLVLLDRIDRADVRVIEGRGGTRLALEPLQGGGVLLEILGQELERHPASEPRVLGLVHDAHPTAAELTSHTVVGDAVSDQGSHHPKHFSSQATAPKRQGCGLMSGWSGFRRRPPTARRITRKRSGGH